MSTRTCYFIQFGLVFATIGTAICSSLWKSQFLLDVSCGLLAASIGSIALSLLVKE